ncbi:TPA: cytolethal distending toxin nuclease subunit Cj-CdtB, partial [Campylobacter jejuni]|nr:cytolethal distending toxin nuclease subunit Cj-CdtB [Campylobacter jejuni]
MKKIICLFLSFNLAFANLENFNVGTWNLQGSSAATESKWSVSVRQLVSGANPLDILMIQEAGTLPRTATPTGRHVQQGGTPIDEYEWNLGTLSRPDRVFIYYSRVDVGANRVNLAIVSRMQAEEVIVLPPPTTVSRPIIGIRNGNDAFFNIHALANGGTDVGAIITAVDAHFANMPQVNWMIAGDFNRDPSTITSTVDRELANRIRVVFPTSATQASGGTLDYAITGNSNRQQT